MRAGQSAGQSSSHQPPPPPYRETETDSEDEGHHEPGRGSLLDAKYAAGNPHLAPDPRASSTVSLASAVSASDQRRTLLIVYIHGFYGNNQSFRSFPYHVHSYLRSSLADSHVIHSKIYPRYKTYRAIELARDNFSKWLEPHESPTTDIILVGHSMGGILAADVVTLPNTSLYSHHPYKHRILGIVGLDCPYLGLHPGIVVAGISSLFQSSEQPSAESQQDQLSQQDSHSTINIHSPQNESPISSPPPRQQTTDPYFDPPFFNDKPFNEAPFRKRIAKFAKKHYNEGILNATTKHVLSHLEYGGCLADFPGLNARYKKIRELEDVDDLEDVSNGQTQRKKARVRFVNYYTLSSGRKKQPKPSEQENTSQTNLTPTTSGNPGSPSNFSREETNETDPSTMSHSMSQMSITMEDHSEKRDPDSKLPDYDQGTVPDSSNEKWPDEKAEPHQEYGDTIVMQQVKPEPMASNEAPAETSTETRDLDLAPIPELPPEPVQPDFDQYMDKDARKQAEKEYKRVQKAYAKSVKDRDKAIKEREKIVQKRRAKEEKEARKLEKGKGKEKVEENTSTAPEETQAVESNEPTKPQKRKKFCTLPSKKDGEVDPTWVDVYMDGMDEVSAHCGLFFPGPHYDKLIGDVSSRVIGWVQDDMTKRMILAMQQEQVVRETT